MPIRPEIPLSVQCRRCNTEQDLHPKSVTVFLDEEETLAIWQCWACVERTGRGSQLVDDPAEVKVFRAAGAHEVLGHPTLVRPILFEECRRCGIRYQVPMVHALVFDLPTPYGYVQCPGCGDDTPVTDPEQCLAAGCTFGSDRDEAMINILRDPGYQPHAAIQQARVRQAPLDRLRRRKKYICEDETGESA